MEKAYDKVYWPFLFTVLIQFRFHPRFISWIRAYIQNFNLALLINGTPSQWIQASRGLHHGCPLSPYLFILCSEVLFKILQYVVKHRLLKAYQFPRKSSAIFYFFFANDCLLVAKATVLDVACLRIIVDAYYNIFRQAINFSKS